MFTRLTQFLFVGLLLAYGYTNAQNLQLDSTLLTSRDVATGLQVPWEVQYGADDHLWVTERRGRILRINPENGNIETILNYEAEVNSGGEPGMLGMALHPDFPTTPLVYVVYCYGSFGNSGERVVTFTWNGSELVDENIIFDGIPTGGIHNGSRMLITTDNKILLTTGDRGSSSTSQNLNSLNGKVLRMNLDGSLPDDNPIPDSYVYSYGHRNAQGLAYGPNGQVYSSEHGQSNSDEFNIIEPNRNYGWPQVEGACNTNSEQAFCAANEVREPLDEYSPCAAVNDIIFYDHPAIPEWEGKMLMAVLGGFALSDSRISVLTFNEDGTAVIDEQQYLDNLGRLRDVAINPHTGAIYVATNGPFYPGSGPNRIIEYRNLEYEVVSTRTPNTDDQFIRLFPNPASEVLNVAHSGNFSQRTAEIVSFSGQTVRAQVLIGEQTEIDLKGLAPGMYFIRASNEEGMITRVFTKL